MHEVFNLPRVVIPTPTDTPDEIKDLLLKISFSSFLEKIDDEEGEVSGVEYRLRHVLGRKSLVLKKGIGCFMILVFQGSEIVDACYYGDPKKHIEFLERLLDFEKCLIC
jgi:hypothetical protein